MPSSIASVLYRPDIFHTALLNDEDLFRLNRSLIIAGILGGMAYGAAVGSYVGGIHMLLTTVKMPVFFLVTTGVCFLFMHLTLLIAGGQVRAAQTLSVVLCAVSITSLVLAASAPVIALFCASAAFPDYATYIRLWLLNALAGLVAGVFGIRTLWRGLGTLLGNLDARKGLAVIWVVAFQFVGAQVAWLLRPWIGSSYDVHGYFDWSHSLQSNVYVALWDVIRTGIYHIGSPM